MIYDEARGCVRFGTEVPLACAAQSHGHGTCASLGTTGCAITREGGVRKVWFLGSRSPGVELEPCPDDLTQKVSNPQPCADAG